MTLIKSGTIILIFVSIACTNNNKPSERNIQSPQKQEFQIIHEYLPHEVETFDSATLRLKRNEIFAQYGYRFKSPELKNHFDKKWWYKPQHSNVDSLLTDLDKRNIALLQARESEMNRIKAYDCGFVTNEISEFTFYSSIQSVIDSLGLPTQSFVDRDPFCPVGQIHYWDHSEIELEIIILGDSYDEDVNLQAKSRLYAIKAINKFDVSVFGFSGIKLGEDSSSVGLKLQCLVNRFPEYSFFKSTGSSAVERFLIQEQSAVYVLTNKKLWIHFSLNPFGKVDYILFSTFNARGAC